MSPEQALGQAGGRRPPDRHLLAGRDALRAADAAARPSTAGDRQEILRQIAEEEPRPPRRLNPAVPARPGDDRPQGDGQGAGAALRDGRRAGRRPAAVPGGPAGPGPSHPIWRRAVTWVRTHRTATALIAAGIAMMILIASVWSLLQRKEAEFLARRFESASIAELAEIIPLLDVSGPGRPRVARPALRRRRPRQEAGRRARAGPDTRRMSGLRPRPVPERRPPPAGSADPLLQRQIPGPFIAGLEAEIRRRASPRLSPGEAEIRDRRRANAACALIALGRDGRRPGSSSSAPDPQARSFLIATLGPAGVEPDRLVARLDDPPNDTSSRRP